MLEIPYVFVWEKIQKNLQKFRKSLTTPPSADPRSETPSLQKRSRRHEISHMRLFRGTVNHPMFPVLFWCLRPQGVAVLQENLLSFFFVFLPIVCYGVSCSFSCFCLLVVLFSLSAPEHKIRKSLVLSSTSRRRLIIFPPHLLL